MKRKKTDAPFDLRDPIVAEVRGTSGAAAALVDARGAAQTDCTEV